MDRIVWIPAMRQGWYTQEPEESITVETELKKIRKSMIQATK